ncbi:transmembrane protein 26-like isoform X2 [Hyperolius riggenbachi]|uniref:transmembrane protein 26-like isoform X2 n=1 Tax=Hyperolius riggenbachi TaxID=752182 RepID=UPI0035A31F76
MEMVVSYLKRFSPMVFIYLCTVLPSIIVAELQLFETRVKLSNSTHYECMDYGYTEYAHFLQGLEETVILVLVIGRWLMPKGGLTRDQLSQLLLTYLALGADILDVLQLIKETKINTNRNVTIVGLCLFSWAILQFTIVLTQTASPSSQKTSVTEESLTTSATKILRPCCDTEIWSVIITVGMQDGPFLLYRVYLATAEGVFNESMTFFICKNTLTVIIQMYRVVVNLYQKKRDRKIALKSYIDTGISQTDMSVT